MFFALFADISLLVIHVQADHMTLIWVEYERRKNTIFTVYIIFYGSQLNACQ